jgi:hypothetical protein
MVNERSCKREIERQREKENERESARSHVCSAKHASHVSEMNTRKKKVICRQVSHACTGLRPNPEQATALTLSP